MRNENNSMPSAPRRKMHPTLYAFLVMPFDPVTDKSPLLFYAERAVLVSLWYRTGKLNFRRNAAKAQVIEAINDEVAYISPEFLFAATGLLRPSELAAHVWISCAFCLTRLPHVLLMCASFRPRINKETLICQLKYLMYLHREVLPLCMHCMTCMKCPARS